jgi:hypothetical protein
MVLESVLVLVLVLVPALELVLVPALELEPVRHKLQQLR